VKHYYQDEWATLYLGDCREVLPAVDAQIVITDPPYNVGISYGGGTDDSRGATEYEDWCHEWFTIANATPGRCIAITPGIVNVAMWLRLFPHPTWILAWWKPAAMGRSPVGFCNWEPIILYGKPRGDKRVDVIRAPIRPSGEYGGHPCPKPTGWATGQIAVLAGADDVVMDPFMGTGTTLLAAKESGRKSIGIEIEESYCEIAAKRLDQGVLW
jgi:site-specific DNA-methyltransferase (adenine-specific)